MSKVLIEVLHDVKKLPFNKKEKKDFRNVVVTGATEVELLSEDDAKRLR